jgi:EAL domain-containing protein (putative c-di-GMP-specific phosphodiesterase class I)/GGDEF domain-containing protein
MRLPVIRSDREAHPARELARVWTRVFDHVVEPELRLRAVLSLSRMLANAQRGIVFAEDSVLAGFPGANDAPPVRRLFERARRVLEDELITPELYVARIAPSRPERLALRWNSADDGAVDVARAIAASCAWALDPQFVPARAPAELPDGTATLQRLEQLVHDARRMRRSFAVVYVELEAPASAVAGAFARDAVARNLRREVRANDHLGHLGGDAYLALLSLDGNESEAYHAAQRLLRVAAAAASDATANVGVAICPEDGVLAEDLVEKASAAAMAAASVGGAQPYWYRESVGRALRERALTRAVLADGDPATLFELRYAPVFEAQTGTLWGATAAVHWRAPDAPALTPLAYLGDESERAARDALQRWLIANAARAQRSWRAVGLDVRVHLVLATTGDAALEAISAGFGSDDSMRRAWIEIAADRPESGELESFARKLHALGAAVGIGAWRTPFDVAGGLIDFVSVADGPDVRTLAALALGSVLAPVVIAGGVPDRERARWLARHGATALTGKGLSAPMGLPELVRWASDRAGSIGL